jgi:hypothetical protein
MWSANMLLIRELALTRISAVLKGHHTKACQAYYNLWFKTMFLRCPEYVPDDLRTMAQEEFLCIHMLAGPVSTRETMPKKNTVFACKQLNDSDFLVPYQRCRHCAVWKPPANTK